MENKISAFIFITIFLTIYGSLNFYVIYRLAYLLSIPRKFYLNIFFLLCVFSYVAAVMVDYSFNNLFSRIFYFAAAIWMGFFFLSLSHLVVFDVINFFYKFPRKTAGYVIIFSVFILSAYAMHHAGKIEVRPIEIKSKKLKSDLHIVQISDLHIGTINKKVFLSRVVNEINKLKPDLVVVTGDLFDGPHQYKAETFSPFNLIKVPILFVTGNHEEYAGLEVVDKILKETNIRAVRDEVIEFREVQITGFNDSFDRQQVAKKLEKIKLEPGKFTILLYHRPDGAEAVNKYGVDLMLTGHLHGGQIYPFNLLTSVFYRPIKGLHKINGSYIYISTGTGTWGPPMRLGTTNEITSIMLKPEN